MHLDTLSRKIFGTPLSVGAEVLREAVAEEVQRSGLSSLMENAVEVRISEEGELKIETIELIYNNFSLRALHPEGAIHNLSGELITENTSAKKAIVELLDSTARHSNKKASIWVNDNEEVIAIDGAPAVVVFDDEIRFSRIGEGVEFELAKRVTSLHNRKITTAEIRLDDIYRAKELFSIDYRGILANAMKRTTRVSKVPHKLPNQLVKRKYRAAIQINTIIPRIKKKRKGLEN